MDARGRLDVPQSAAQDARQRRMIAPEDLVPTHLQSGPIAEARQLMSKKLLTGLAPLVVVAVLSVIPTVAQATPQFRINGNLVGTAHQHIVQYGTLTLKSGFSGEWKCKVIAGAAIWNEGGNGFASLEAWQPYLCSASECPGEAFVTTEMGPELIEKINAQSEKEYSAKRRNPSLPWPAETFTEEGRSRLNMRKMRLVLNCPQENLAVPFTGNLEPLIVNGLQNGLSPSHLVFEGQGGKTGFLGGACNFLECEAFNLYASGELTTLGTSQQLITAE
jgi:hypothetical protein